MLDDKRSDDYWLALFDDKRPDLFNFNPPTVGRLTTFEFCIGFHVLQRRTRP